MFKICFLLIIIPVIFLFPIPESIYSPQTVPLWVLKAENDPVFAYVMEHESNNNPESYNAMDTDGRPKYGLLSMGWEEFYSWAPKAGIIDPYIYNGNHQVIVWDWAAKNGLLRSWGTFCELFPK